MKNIKYIAAAFLLSGMVHAQSLDINKMPKSVETPIVNVAQPNIFKLKNGLTIMVVENNKLPRVNMELFIDYPPVYEGEKVGTSIILASQLGKATSKLSKEEFSRQVDYLGANITFTQSGARVNTLSKYYPQVIDLLAQAIISPKFSADEIKSDKERMLESLKADEKNASKISRNVSQALTFGKNTAYGEFATEMSIDKIELSDVEQYYKNYFNPDNAYLVIVGDVKFSEVKKIVEKQFKSWKKSGVKHNVAPLAQNVEKTEINFVDVPTAVQSVISVGNISKLQKKDPLYFAGILGNDILGAGGESRLFLNLREKNGFTYGAYSSLSTGRFTPHFTAHASVRNEVTDKAVIEFMNELNGISKVTQEELDLVKAKRKGDFIRALENPAMIAEYAIDEIIDQLPQDFYKNYLKSIDNVTISDVNKAVTQNILPNQSRIVIVGKASEVADSVEKLGYPVKYYDREANPTTKPEAKKIDTNVTVATIGEKYISAIGGKSNVDKVTSVTMNAVGKIQGMDLEFITTQAKGGKSIVELKMMGNTMNKVVFNGKDGFVQAQGQKVPLPEEVKAEMLNASKEVFPELDFSVANYELKGIENINEEEAYAIKPKQGNKTYYYSVKTGLKIAEIVVQKVQGQEIVVPTYFSDYKEFNGVKFPFKLSSNMGGMDVSFDVKSYELNKVSDKDFQ